MASDTQLNPSHPSTPPGAAELEHRLRAMEDQLALNALIGRYRDLADGFDYAGWADLFTEDAVFDMPDSPFAMLVGRDAIRTAAIAQNRGSWASTQHCMINSQFIVEGDAAHGIGDKITIGVPATGSGKSDFRMWGTRYAYRFRRTEQGWRIAELRGEALWVSGGADLSAAYDALAAART